MRSAGIETSPLYLCVSVVNILDAPNKSGHDALRVSGEREWRAVIAPSPLTGEGWGGGD